MVFTYSEYVSILPFYLLNTQCLVNLFQDHSCFVWVGSDIYDDIFHMVGDFDHISEWMVNYRHLFL